MHQSNGLYFYSGSNIFHNNERYFSDLPSENYAGISSYLAIHKSFGSNLSFHDRSGTITTPFKTISIPGLELPKMAKQPLTFEEICNKRAIELFNRAKNNNKKLVVMYSGGVDSTLVVVSLLKNISKQDLKDHVIILMNDDSIVENRRFYDEHITKVFEVRNSHFFHRYIGDPRYIIVTGEGNDQLFGSAVITNNTHAFTTKPWEVKPDPDLLIKHFEGECESYEDGKMVYEILNTICLNAPFEVDSIYKWLWWINFTCKWQSVYMRSATFAIKQHHDTFNMDDYTMFYSPVDFQLWSMNNSDKLICDTMKKYKQTCKDIIYDFNKDTDYRDYKVKMGSLRALLLKKETCIAINDQLDFLYEFDVETFMRPDNTFANYR